MTIYSVHNRPGRRLDEAVFVKDGFAWPGFLFTFVWALWNRMWIVAAIIFMVSAAVAIMASALELGTAPANLASLAVSLIVGFEGNELRRWSLARRGFDTVGLAAGKNLHEAELRYFSAKRQSIELAGPSPARPQAFTADPLGLFGPG